MITFRFFDVGEQDDEVARAMQSTERRILRETNADLKSAFEVRYAELEAWFGGDTTRLNAAVSRVSGR